MSDESQSLPKLSQQFDIEHIYPKKRQENERGLSDSKQIEALGNKALLEKRINIRAADYRFEDKIKYYNGFTNDKGQKKDGTINLELKKMSENYKEFGQEEIGQRNSQIIDNFMDLLSKNNLIA